MNPPYSFDLAPSEFKTQEFKAENLITHDINKQKSKYPDCGDQRQQITEVIVSMNLMAMVKLKLFAVLLKMYHKKEILLGLILK